MGPIVQHQTTNMNHTALMSVMRNHQLEPSFEEKRSAKSVIRVYKMNNVVARNLGVSALYDVNETE
jgi:hypothetical protein